MTRLIYLSASTIPSAAANSVQVMKACEAFALNGVDTILYVERADTADPFPAYGCASIFRLEPYPKRDRLRLPFGLARRLVDHRFRHGIRRQAPDIVYGRSLRWLTRVVANGGTANAVVGVELHMPPLADESRELFADLLRLVPRLRVVAISAAMRDLMLARTPGLTPEQILVMHNGADLGLGEGPARPLGPGFRLGYVGGLYPGCGLDTIAAAISGMDRIALDVVGGTPEEIADWRRRLPQDAAVTWHGRVPPAEVGSFLRGFDAVVAPYMPEAEGHGGVPKAQWMSPLKIFEAMAAGRPILASDLPVVRELLEDGTTGLLLPPGDTASWRTTLLSLRDDPALARRLGDAAQARCAERHSWTARARQLLDFLRPG